ncbi:MAG: sensor histidine kinase [Pelosinus sp.]|nr:sensor histidine kinase [Pelosinus sp.]
MNFMKNSGSSIRFKLLIYFNLLIIFPIFTLGLIGNIIYSTSMEKQTNNHTVQMIEQVKHNVEFHISDMENIIYYLAQDPSIADFMSTAADSADRQAVEAKVRKEVSAFERIHPEIAGILVANEQDLYISNAMHKLSRDSLTTEMWYREAAAAPADIHLLSKPLGRNLAIGYSADDVVSVVKALNDPVTGQCKGVILIDLRLDIIKKITEDIKLGKNGFIYITDANGGIVYAPVNPIVYRIKAEGLDDALSSVIKKIGQARYQIIYEQSKYTKWKTIGVFSVEETEEEIARIRIIFFGIGLLTLVLAFMAAMYFTSSIAKPLSKLRSLMKQAEEGDLTVQFKSRYNDEIGQLGNSFNNMIREISKLIELVYTEQKSKREAELKTLQAQIKPHFLYNTLDTIHWMAQAHGADDIEEVVGALANLFRIGLSKGKEMITVGEELKHIKSYLIIQKARYEDKLDYAVEFDEDILHYSVIKLLLQPLVENAIYHGLNAKRGGGKLVIIAKKRNNQLYFSVTDNGNGITPEKIQEINEMLLKKKSPENLGYGVFNVNERIRLVFGDEYGLIFHSVYGEGTTVEIWHPLIEGLG